MLSSTLPCTLDGSQHTGIDIILSHNACFRLHIPVVPHSSNLACYLAVSLLGIINVALEDAHEVGKYVEVVDVIITAINVGQTRNLLSCRTPHLRHVSTCRRGYRHPADGIPHHHSLAFGMNVVGNCLQEIGVCDLLFVGADVDVRRFGKDLAHFVKNVFQFCHALIRLHRMTHSTLKGLTVSGHVYLGNHLYAVVCGKTDNFATFFLCVILADKARHAGGRCQLWVLLHFEAPCLVFGQMPVEGIDLETTHQAYLTLQLIDTNITASHIVHPTTKFEGWPIGY